VLAEASTLMAGLAAVADEVRALIAET